MNISKAIARSTVSVAFLAVLIILGAAGPASAASSTGVVSTPPQEEIVLYAQEHPTDLASYSSTGIPRS